MLTLSSKFTFLHPFSHYMVYVYKVCVYTRGKKLPFHSERRLLTDEVVRAEEVVVPDLHCEARVHVHLRLAQTVEVLLLLDDYHLLRREVLEREHKAPVEVALSVHGAVVHVRLLSIVLSTNPAVCVLCEGVYV